ncbi:MAG: hypothetical protein LBD48_05090 [Treponema sp.]|jgi:hypothetical protein|nr:hypothetical protein [Treponema sp.]
MKNSLVLVNALLALCLFARCAGATVPSVDREELGTGGLSSDELAALNGGGGGTPGGGSGSGSGAEALVTLVSVGPATAAGALTYYVDGENGNDANNGTSPSTPWKSFKNVNAKTFSPGDHILLEADSTWNGDSVTAANYATLGATDKVGMLYPKGSGAPYNHCVIDLYDVHNFGQADQSVSYRSSRRPVINGNGTPAPDTRQSRWYMSGAVTLFDSHHWKIRNLELTNTFDDPIANPNHWYAPSVPKHLAGILVASTPFDPALASTTPNGFRGPVNPDDPESYNIIIQNCYVHDVQSMHNDNGASTIFGNSSALGASTSPPLGKLGGGILLIESASLVDGAVYPNASYYKGWDGLLVEGNIVKKTMTVGIRNAGFTDKAASEEYSDFGTNQGNNHFVIRGNYLEKVFGDGLVICSVNAGVHANSRKDGKNGLVESNIFKDTCYGPNSKGNWAAAWAMRSNHTVFQYNEAYGALYGKYDGEAWDVDQYCRRVVYQYNYSHHNQGGAILFMTQQYDSVFRYNISANDGGGTRYLETITPNVDHSSDSWSLYPVGQTLIHNHSATVGDYKVPLIYNNTFYVGPGVTTWLYAMSHTPANVNWAARFYNNIIVKAGPGRVNLSGNHAANGTYGHFYNEAAGFRNNLLWGYDTDPAAGDLTKFNNGDGTAIGTFVNANGNRWLNPKLPVQSGGYFEDELRAQRDDEFTEYNDPDSLKAFTGKSRLRRRASLFAPAAGSPAIGAGLNIPLGDSIAVPGGESGIWNGGTVTEDFFGQALGGVSPIGAAAGPYRSAY